MGAGHSHALYVHGHTAIHRLPPEAKVAATFAFVSVVALTPPRAVWAFVADAIVLAVVVRASRVSPRFLAARAMVALPFMVGALFIPFVATGEQTELLGLSVSAEGLVAARALLLRTGLGVTAAVTLAATTETPAIMAGLTRLRVPAVITTIATFMIRYLEVLAGELGRMRTAMTARAYDPRWLWQAKPIAQSAGALFIRSYERGERVHNAMLARGFTGQMPVIDSRTATGRHWALALSPAAVAALSATLTVILLP